MSLSKLSDRLRCIVDDYEGQGREPQRVLEMISCLVREPDEFQSLCKPMEQIRLAVQVWEQGERPDLDALETIAALIRQM